MEDPDPDDYELERGYWEDCEKATMFGVKGPYA